MNFNRHSELEGRHAFLSASKYHWIRYDDDKILNSWSTSKEAMRGSELHEFAAFAIRIRQKLPKTQQTLNMFVNDAIGLHMTPEQVIVPLRDSHLAFGTADAISFQPSRDPERRGRMLLRIHDLKTGITKTNVNQLEIYAAFFCLEYNVDPFEIDIELRIYQHDERLIFIPDPEDIKNIMAKTVHFVSLLTTAMRETA